MQIDEKTLRTFHDSLGRSNANPAFLDRFYEIFLAASPKVREKFAQTDFTRQKEALRGSLHAMFLAVEGAPERHLNRLAERHSSRDLNIGAELYDLWLDSLLAAARECDPDFSPEVEESWEKVMMVGIGFLLSRY